MKKYTLEAFIGEDGAGAVHESADPLNVHDARVLISILEEYKIKLLTFISLNQTHENLKNQEGKKVE